MKYDVILMDCNNNVYNVLIGADEKTFTDFLNDYCDTKEPYDLNMYWVKGFEIPEYNIPYRNNGWLVKCFEYEDE